MRLIKQIDAQINNLNSLVDDFQISWVHCAETKTDLVVDLCPTQ